MIATRFDPLRAAAAVAVVLCAGAIPATAQTCVGYFERTLAEGGTSGAESVTAGDLDGDGDVDVVVASFGDDSIRWYENRAVVSRRPGGVIGTPSFPDAPHLITDQMVGASSVSVVDLDGDGDLDVLATARGENRVAWFDNNGLSPPVFTRRTIAEDAVIALAASAADVRPDGSLGDGDLNGDGHRDVVSASFGDDKIAWYESDGAATPTFTAHAITTAADGASDVGMADIDLDGDIDVVAVSRQDDGVAWFENDGVTAPDVPTFTRRAIDDPPAPPDGPYALALGDVDGDGRVDVVVSGRLDGAVYLYRNVLVSGAVQFVRSVVTSNAPGAADVAIADVDHDGARDIVVASSDDDTVAWYRNNPGGSPAWQPNTISDTTKGAHGVFPVVFDPVDGHADVLSASSVPGFPASADKVAWFENNRAAYPGTDFTEHVLSGSADGAVAVALADLDDDGDLDVATAGRTDKVAWFENDGATAPTFAENGIASTLTAPVTIVAGTIDADAIPDLVVGGADGVVWFKNDGPPYPQLVEMPVAPMLEDVRSVALADVDEDGALDVLVAAAGDTTVAWYRNDGGSFSENVVSATVEGASALIAADLNDAVDDHPDLVSTGSGDTTLIWWEHDGAVAPDTPAFTEHVITTTFDEASDVAAGDLDEDGHVDLVVAASALGTLSWFRNDGATEPTFVESTLATRAPGVSDVEIIDLDDDGDLDVLAVAATSGRLLWYENVGAGSGVTPTFELHTVTTGLDLASHVAVGDIGGAAAGLDDLVVGERLEISWFEGSGEICGTFALGPPYDDDDRIGAVELAWMGRAFGLSSDDPTAEWWYPMDYNQDGTIDGDDLAILASSGVFGQTTSECSFVCQ